VARSSDFSLAGLLRIFGNERALDHQLSHIARVLKPGPVRSGLERLTADREIPLREFLGSPSLHSQVRVPEAQLVNELLLYLHRPLQPAPRVDEALTFLELAEQLDGSALAETPLMEALASVRVDMRVRQRLFAIATRRPSSVIDFLHDADEDDDWSDEEYRTTVKAFSRWIEEHDRARVPAGPAARAPQPTAHRTRGAVLSLAAELGIPDLEDWQLGQLMDGQAFAPPSTVSVAAGSNPADLERRLKAFASRVATARSAKPPSAGPVSTPAVAVLQAAAREERVRLAASWPFTLCHSRVVTDLTGSQLRVAVTPYGATRQARVTLTIPSWHERRQLDCTCSRTACVHRIAVLDLLAFKVSTDAELEATLATGLRPEWERLLDVLSVAPPVRAQERGVLSFELDGRSVGCRFHVIGKRGVPSKSGRAVDPGAVLDKLEGADRRLAEKFALVRAHGANDSSLGEALLQLEGHARVFWDDEREPSTVARVEASLRVEQTTAGYRLVFHANELPLSRELPTWRCATGRVGVLKAGPGKLLLVHLSDVYLSLFSATAKLGTELPREAAPRLAQVLPELETNALVELPDDLRGDERPPQCRPVVRVQPSGTGLALAIRVMPLEGGPVFVPGHGVGVSASFDGQRRSFTRRAFEQELAEANSLAATLGLDPGVSLEPSTWALDRGEASIEVLRRLTGSGVEVEWTAPKVTFTREFRLDELRLAVTKKRDWFGLDGALTADDRRVSLAVLLEAARHRRRFVKLGEADYAQLSDELLEALNPIAMLALEGKDPELTVGTLPLIDALAPRLASFDAAAEWRGLMTKLEHSRKASFPLPRGLKATLREYQTEGYEWAMRLSQWCSGALLADDMGLGKTLQALGLLLARAKLGPALVVAPSSVLHTWRTEAERFAPSLKLHSYEDGERELERRGPGTVTIVSWSLFARDAESFERAHFATAVFDEAQAMKNAATQRAKAAHALNADFRLALSGTPIENHVGELWSLFRAVMPLVLGSEDSFRLRFASGTKDAQKALAALVRPFILRRTKGAVAQELPPRTDVDLFVPLSAQERALYDDVRLNALSNLGGELVETKRFDVLAALTRLRLAACHPRLVDAGWAGPTSKLDRLLDLLRSLIDGGHRVLVFSQFTQHLALVMAALKREGITFSSLDGQVPSAERQRRVELFQRGKGGDVFLISLKAGGTGLTLTAADYVVHLDPWWNPAVEDQASDRAHRIGQTRPVTVYRLIAEGTVEQQILSLHRDKRELADALLAGTDTVGKLSTTQLAELIRGVS
jgi:superfamily II DNA or RNA helicase